MNCVVPGRGIRGEWLHVDHLSVCYYSVCLSPSAFGKAVQCLAKIGEDLHIEALEKGVSAF